MSILFTVIDDTYSANGTDGKKRIWGTVSLTNPYTANGEVITTSTYFKTKFLGGKVMMVDQQVTAANTGIALTGTFRGNTASTSVTLLQFFSVGLTGTANAGLFVDCSTANLSSTTLTVQMEGY